MITSYFPNHARTHYQLYICYKLLKNAKLSNEYYNKSIKLNPKLSTENAGNCNSFGSILYDVVTIFISFLTFFQTQYVRF